MARQQSLPAPPERVGRRVTHPASIGPGANQNDTQDMNVLIAQYKKHGTMPNVPVKNPLYGDFTFPDDIHEVREATIIAEERFGELPADVRTAAKNDWIEFLEMFDDPDRQKTLIDAGLEINSAPSEKQTQTRIPNNSPPPAATIPPETNVATASPTPTETEKTP